MLDILAETQKRRVYDAERFEKLDPDVCMCCGTKGYDRRSLFIDCFYDISEVVPVAIDLHAVKAPPVKGQGWYLRVCKRCRGDFLAMLRKWYNMAQGKGPDDDAEIVVDPNAVVCPSCGSNSTTELDVERDGSILEYICYACGEDFEIEGKHETHNLVP